MKVYCDRSSCAFDNTEMVYKQSGTIEQWVCPSCHNTISKDKARRLAALAELKRDSIVYLPCEKCSWVRRVTVRVRSWGGTLPIYNELCAVCAAKEVVQARKHDLSRALEKLSQEEAAQAKQVKERRQIDWTPPSPKEILEHASVWDDDARDGCGAYVALCGAKSRRFVTSDRRTNCDNCKKKLLALKWCDRELGDHGDET